MAENNSGKLIALPLLVMALAGAWWGVSTLHADMAFTAAKTEVSFWGRPNYQPTPATIERTGNNIGRLTANSTLYSIHPEHLALQAAYASWRSFWAGNSSERAEFATLAVNSQFAALESRPAHRHGWAKMVEYASRDAQGAAQLELAQARLSALQPARQ